MYYILTKINYNKVRNYLLFNLVINYNNNNNIEITIKIKITEHNTFFYM